MYRSSQRYDELDKMVCDIYTDYGFRNFPLDERTVCATLGISLVPYSEFCNDDRIVLKKRSQYGFFAKETIFNPPVIFYNDDLSELQSQGCIRLTIFHEIKHYVCNDDEDAEEEDDLAEHFGRYFLCPTPYLVINDIVHPAEISSRFGISITTAGNVSSSVKNRIAKYGHKLFDYEKPLIQLLDCCYYETFVTPDKRGDAL